MILFHNYSEGFEAFQTSRLVFQEAPKHEPPKPINLPEIIVHGKAPEAQAKDAKDAGEKITKQAQSAIREKAGKKGGLNLAGLEAPKVEGPKVKPNPEYDRAANQPFSKGQTVRGAEGLERRLEAEARKKEKGAA